MRILWRLEKGFSAQLHPRMRDIQLRKKTFLHKEKPKQTGWDLRFSQLLQEEKTTLAECYMLWLNSRRGSGQYRVCARLFTFHFLTCNLLSQETQPRSKVWLKRDSRIWHDIFTTRTVKNVSPLADRKTTNSRYGNQGSAKGSKFRVKLMMGKWSLKEPFKGKERWKR